MAAIVTKPRFVRRSHLKTEEPIFPYRLTRPDVIVPGGGHLLPLTHADAVNEFLRSRMKSIVATNLERTEAWRSAISLRKRVGVGESRVQCLLP